MNTLTIARYKDGYIKITEYNKTIHKNGEIFCPFCNPSLEVTGVENKFFRALPKRGGHNCGRRAVEYFNAEWEGRLLIETVKGDEGEIEIVIDINSLAKMRKGLSNISITQEPEDNATNNDMEKYNRYKTYKKVLRDIVRTVYQMKMLIEKNSIDDLGKIKFKYKMGNEELGINEVVIPVDELNKNLHYKERFVIYVVDSVRVSNGKIYINSYETEGNTITTSFNYPSKRNQAGINKDDMIIAFGRISYYEPTDQYYLNILSDLNIVKINDEELIERFNNKKMNRREFIKKDSTLENKEHNIVNVDLIKSSSLKDITSYQEATERDQQIQPRVIKEVIKKDILSDNDHKYGVASMEQVSKETGFFSKVISKLSCILRNR
ncbi:hypothetical protein SAMN05660462_01943 [Proteiniborus ethanoligenes]|uniref:Uncharacterized protein n=1 Tax=Proteiniborus ethanoligenes TaxID=415015 RepID=A0A1H3QHI9_9FIRM|nr:hypothetical protein [Proteiniborus ethanoligenes]SDZ12601.1 hypothetical protein SAMN05660462_01943 [Proteiniborus ethanoligenes]